MKKVLIFGALVALVCCGFAGVAKADTCDPSNCITAGGVTYTFTTGGSDGSGGNFITLTIDTTGASEGAATMNSFAVKFEGATSVSLTSFPGGTGSWVLEGQGPNSQNGCNIVGSGPKYCVDGGGIDFGVGSGGTFAFVFDVKGTITKEGIQTMQGPTGYAISCDIGDAECKPPTNTPEPASMLLLGLGLAGVPFLRRRRS